MIWLSRCCNQTKLQRSTIAGRDKWKVWLRSQKRSFSHYIFFKEINKGITSFPPGHDIGSNSSRGHSLLPADHSGPIAGGGVTSFPLDHDSGTLVGGGITPDHDSGTYLVTKISYFAL